MAAIVRVRSTRKRLNRAALSIKFAGLDIMEMSRVPLERLGDLLRPFTAKTSAPTERELVAQRVSEDVVKRLAVLLELGLGYLTLERGTPTLSPGELQRLRLATAVYSNLFGVVYVLDEPSAGLHPADTEALLGALDRLVASGNSLFVVEHDLDVIRHADWIVDVGPAAGEQGGHILYSGPPPGLATIAASQTRMYLFDREAGEADRAPSGARTLSTPERWLRLEGITRNNLDHLDVGIPLGVLTSVTGVSTRCRAGASRIFSFCASCRVGTAR